MSVYNSIRVDREGAVAIVRMFDFDVNRPLGAKTLHWELGDALDRLRFDNDIRVVVVTGHGKNFYAQPPGRPKMENHRPGDDWDMGLGLQRSLQAVIEMEKPVIARVHGQTAGFGTSLTFACDFIIAAEDAIFGDSHLAMGEGDYNPLGRTDGGTTPGDGGTVFVPFHMTPPIAREFLWLAKQYTGADLAGMGAINAAVPEAELDAAVGRMAAALLRRPAYALALSKRAFNRYIAARFNQSFDLSWSYELLNFYQYGRYVDGRGDKKL